MTEQSPRLLDVSRFEYELPEPMKVGDRIPTAAGQVMVITAIHPPDADGAIRATAELELEGTGHE